MSADLTIATVPLPTGGRIGICRLPGITGSLVADIDAICTWNAAYLVTMTGLGEMERAGVVDLPRQAEAAGIRWRHFPIVDFGAPEAEVLRGWPALSAELHAALDAGQSVLTHCRAGLGRSGMVSLRLLVERGEDPDAALARIREVRPGAVETQAQRYWASGPVHE
jgi:protein-tyrosine phosphatase